MGAVHSLMCPISIPYICAETLEYFPLISLTNGLRL